MDEYHDRLEDFAEEDENIDSDDDNNAPPRGRNRGKAFEMEVINF